MHLIEQIRLSDRATRGIRAKVLAWAVDGPVGIEELGKAGLVPVALGPQVLRTYSVVRALRSDPPSRS